MTAVGTLDSGHIPCAGEGCHEQSRKASGTLQARVQPASGMMYRFQTYRPLLKLATVIMASSIEPFERLRGGGECAE